MEFSDVTSSLHHGGLFIVVQPAIDLRSGKAVAFEALARLKLGDGFIAPGEFLPQLTQSDQDFLFRQVLDRFLGHVRAWRLEGIRVGASVNVDPGTLADPRCSTWVAEALERHEMRVDRFAVEVLETGPVDTGRQTETLLRLRGLGLKLCMDDFGAGYSTTTRLAAIPFDVVKIDGATVQSLQQDPAAAFATMSKFVRASADRGCLVVCEGVESPDLAEAVRLLGSHMAQGFLYARPMSPERVPDWMRSQPPPSPQDRITTPLGAYAYHWSASATGGTHPGAVEDCPMTAVLADDSAGCDQMRRWHDSQHQAVADPASARALAAALEERIVNRRPGGSQVASG